MCGLWWLARAERGLRCIFVLVVMCPDCAPERRLGSPVAAWAAIPAAGGARGCVEPRGLQHGRVSGQEEHAALRERCISSTRGWFMPYKQGWKVFCLGTLHMFCSSVDLMLFFNPCLQRSSLFSFPLCGTASAADVTVPPGRRMQQLFRLDPFPRVWVVPGRELAMSSAVGFTRSIATPAALRWLLLLLTG